MAKLLLNPEYVASGDVKQTGKYLFDAEDGSAVVSLVTWLETSKKSEKNPDGKLWIILPKDNVTNRKYFSVDLFDATAVDGVVSVEIKTAAPRVLGATGVKQDIIKFLDEETAAEYTTLVNGAVDAYKAAKGSRKAKKPEEMTKEELEVYIEALRNGTKVTVVDGPKSFLDMFDEVQYARYNELLALAAENKANRPKAERKPLTDEEKAVRAAKISANKLSKAEALLAALQTSIAADEAAMEDVDGDEDYSELDEE